MTKTFRITDKKSETIYDTTFKIEILREYASSIGAAFSRYEDGYDTDEMPQLSPAEKQSIDNTQTEIFTLMDSMYGASDEELSEIETQLDKLQIYLYEVNPDAIV